MDNHSIIATNVGTAYYRTFTDIPLSTVVYNHILSLGKKGAFKRTIRDVENTVPYMEARYKAIDAIIHQLGITQIVEIAAGWSPRGMNLTINPKIHYIETDQEIKQKKELVQKLVGKRKNLTIIKLDAITGEGLDNVLKILKPTPTAVIHEGLLRYLNHKQKQEVAQTVRKIIDKTGGVYITPDIITRTKQFINQTKKFKEDSKKVHTNINKNIFKNNNEAKKFYNKCGYNTKTIRYNKLITKLSCTKNKTLNQKIIKKATKKIMNRNIWIMKKI